MGILIDKIGGNKVLNNSSKLAELYKKNSIDFYNSYQRSDNDIKSISNIDIVPGMFYHLHYLDDSNWMKFSPVFITNFKKVSNLIIVFGVNFNFIPIEIRFQLFDKFITDVNIDKNKPLVVTYEGVYNELKKYGFEYALVEYNLKQIKLCHRVSMSSVPNFLVSSYPSNKYDPNKLYSIWQSKIKDKEKRDRELMQSTIDDFYDVRGQISDKYDILKDHISRVQKSLNKYGGY